MSVPTLTPGHKFWLYLGSTDATPVYAKVCGLTAVSIEGTRSVLEAEVRDCAEAADDTPQMIREPSTKSWGVTGAVKYNRAGYELLDAAIMQATGPRYWRIVSKKNNERWDGQFVGSALGIDAPAEGATYATASITLSNSGDITFTPGA